MKRHDELTEKERQSQYEGAYGEGVRCAFEGCSSAHWFHIYDNPPGWVVEGFIAGHEAQTKAMAEGESLY